MEHQLVIHTDSRCRADLGQRGVVLDDAAVRIERLSVFQHDLRQLPAVAGRPHINARALRVVCTDGVGVLDKVDVGLEGV